MATKNELLQFTITNNTTDCNINVPFLSDNSPIINARTKYTWDITGLNLGCGCWSIVINTQTYQVYFTGGLVGLTNGLNNLGFSFFCSTTVGANLFIYTLDDINVYGNLESCFCTTTSTTTTTTTPTPTTSTTTTTTTPPTTTTTSTTTTTTTPIPLANVNISNTFFAGTIDDVKVNGVSIVGATFPLAIGNGTIGTTNQIGTYSIQVFYSGVTLNSHIDCIDSTSFLTCTNMSGSGSVTFTSQVVNTSVDVNIISADANCIPPTTTTTTSTTTTTTTAGPVPYTIDSFGTGSSVLACTTGSPSISVYATPGNTTPIVGMIFYDSPTLTTPYVGGAGWRKFTNGVTNYAGEVDISGQLTNYVTC